MTTSFWADRGPIVATKLLVPEVPAGRVSRPSLVAELRDNRRARLILISAPAGSGKTTVLASWQEDPGEQRPFAWLSLDDRDNDPVRFWGYVLAALRTVAPDIGVGVDDAVRTAGGDLTELALPLLVNALTSLSDPIVLVLDDYHAISNADIHQSIEFLLDHLPRTVQVALAARADPPFMLSRLRANAELLELRVADLRLSIEEADGLLNGSLQLGLAPDQVRILCERTEGWAAGLQLVGLSLRGRDDRQPYIVSFAGDERQIVDYLVTEVLDRQSPEVRDFLLQNLDSTTPHWSIVRRTIEFWPILAPAGRAGASQLILGLARWPPAVVSLPPLVSRSPGPGTRFGHAR
jgi:LuxR family transcriptional regulator, maltose regulon positive regulatory protein